MIRYLFILVCFWNVASAQKEAQLFKTNKPIEGFTRQGHSSDFGTFHAQIDRPAITVEKSGSGFVIKAGYDVYRYDASLNLQWKAVLDKFYSVMGLPQMKIYSDDQCTYFMEWKTNPNNAKKIVISRINPKGEVFAKEYESKVPQTDAFDGFILEGNLFVLVKDIEKKTKTFLYELYVHDKSKEGFPVKRVTFPSDAYEYDKAWNSNFKSHLWWYLTTHDNKAIFSKVYFKDIDGEKKKKTLVIKLIEMSADGKLSEEKIFNFAPELVDSDRSFILPTLQYNATDNSILMTGLMEIDNKKRFNGLYLLKYDYATESVIYKHEYSFEQLLKPELKPKFKVHYEIPERLNYPLQFRDEDVMFDPINNFTDLRLVTDYDINSLTFFDLKFDKYGDHIQTGLTEFRQLISIYNNVAPKPSGYQVLWKDSRKEYVNTMKLSPWDFLNSKANDNKKDDTWWYTFQTSSGSIVFKFDQTESSFSAFIFNRF